MWKKYRKKGKQEMRPYIVGEDMTGISITKGDVLEEGGMVARNGNDHTDQWYIGKQFVKDHYVEVEEAEKVKKSE